MNNPTEWFGSFVTVKGDTDTVYFVVDYTFIDLPHRHGTVDWGGMKMAENGLCLMKADGTFIYMPLSRLEKTDKSFEPKVFTKGTEVKVINKARDDYGKIYKVGCITYPLLSVYSDYPWNSSISLGYTCIQII